MDIFMLKVMLAVVLLCFLFHIVLHLFAIFKPCVTRIAASEVLKDPHKYVRYEHMMYFLRNMVCFFFVLMLFLAVCRGNVKIIKEKDSVGISVNVDNQKVD